MLGSGGSSSDLGGDLLFAAASTPPHMLPWAEESGFSQFGIADPLALITTDDFPLTVQSSFSVIRIAPKCLYRDYLFS